MTDLPKPVMVREAIRRSGEIKVAPGEVGWFGPFDSGADLYRIAEVSRFEDLQELRLIPDTLSEQSSREALDADDAVFREARRHLESERPGCSCESDGNARRTRASARRHDHLINALGPSFTRARSADDPGIRHVYHHLTRWFNKPARYLVGVAAPQNIIVGANGTLVMSPTVHVVHANLIDLSSNSRLRFESGSVNVTCETLRGPIEAPEPGPVSPPDYGWPPPHRPDPLDPGSHLRNVPLGKYLRGYSREFVHARHDRADARKEGY